MKIKRILATLLVATAMLGSTAYHSVAAPVHMPPGMKNVVYWEHCGPANLFGLLRGSWVKQTDNSSARCTNIEGNDCPLYSHATGNYKVKYSNPNNPGQCYQELFDYVNTNHPEDLDVNNACNIIKHNILKVNPNDQNAANEVNPSTVTRSIKILGF